MLEQFDTVANDNAGEVLQILTPYHAKVAGAAKSNIRCFLPKTGDSFEAVDQALGRLQRFGLTDDDYGSFAGDVAAGTRIMARRLQRITAYRNNILGRHIS